MSNQNDINTFEKMNNMKNMLGNSFIEFLKPNIKKKENESVFKMLEMVKDKPEAYLELLAVAIFHQNFDIIKHMVENFKIVETDAPYMKASSFYNSILPDDSKDKINDSKDYMDIQVPFVIMSGIGGDIEIFKYLLRNKLISDKNQCEIIGLSKKYKNGFTSNIIGACAYYGKKELLDYLLRHYKNELNINITTIDKKVKNTKFSFTKEYNGCTPCLLAMLGPSSDSQTLEILKILKNFGANFEVSDSNKDNLLHLATKNKKIECAKYIVDELHLKNLVNEVNKDKYNPLSLAQHLNNDDFISYYSEKNKIDEKEIEENLKSLIEDSANRSAKQTKKSKKNKKKGKYNKNEKEDKKEEENNENQSIEVLRPQIIENNDDDKEEEKKEVEENKKEIKKEEENEEDGKEEIKEKGKKESSKKDNQKSKKSQKVENSEKTEKSEKSENIPKSEPVEIIGLTTKKSKKLKKFKASIKAKFHEGENNDESNKDKDKEKEENKENKKEEDIKEENKKEDIKEEEKEKNEPKKEEGEKKPEKSKKISKKEKRIDKNNEEIEKEKKRKEEEERKKREKEEEEEKERKRLAEEEERQRKELEEQKKREEEEKRRKREEKRKKEEEKRRKEEERRRLEEERKKKEEEERQRKEEEERKRREEEERRRLEEEERKRREEEERKRLEEEERKRREEEEEKEISNSDEENIDENSSEKDEENDMDNVEISKKDYDELNRNYLELEKKFEILEKEKKELTSCLTKLYLENKENSKILPTSNNEENINDLMYLANKEIEEKNHIINELEDKKAMLDLTNIQNFSNEKLKKYKEFYQKNLKIIDDALKKS